MKAKLVGLRHETQASYADLSVPITSMDGLAVNMALAITQEQVESLRKADLLGKWVMLQVGIIPKAVEP